MSKLILKTNALVLTAILFSCCLSLNNLKYPYDFNKQVKADELSLFGKLKYKQVKSRNGFSLLLKNDSLQYIVGGRKLERSDIPYKVLFQSDTLNIISREFDLGKYVTDTLFFYEDECFMKTVVYEDSPLGIKNAIVAHVDFRYYKFLASECWLSDIHYALHYRDTVLRPFPIADVCNKMRSGTDLAFLIDTSYVAMRYRDKNEALLRFSRDWLQW